ncbi:MAG: STAS domain-containing protein [Candidatus Sulfotelmatobacter sp.]
METAIGVFSSRDHAETAVKELLQNGVPQQSIVFLTRSESDANRIGKELGATVGGFAGGAAGMAAGVVAASLLLPGIGTVFALGFGAAALLGLAGAGAGSAVGAGAAHDGKAPQPSSNEKASEDAAFFREVLKEGRSLVVVTTESQEIAASACGTLDRLGLAMPEKTAAKMQTHTRQIEDVVVIDVSGRITLGEGNVALRDLVRELAQNGNHKIIFNLSEVHYIDSSGLGELVKSHTTIRNQGGELKLTNLNKRVHDLLQMTKLSAVFDIHNEEAAALKSFGGASPDKAVA